MLSPVGGGAEGPEGPVSGLAEVAGDGPATLGRDAVRTQVQVPQRAVVMQACMGERGDG